MGLALERVMTPTGRDGPYSSGHGCGRPGSGNRPGPAAGSGPLQLSQVGGGPDGEGPDGDAAAGVEVTVNAEVPRRQGPEQVVGDTVDTVFMEGPSFRYRIRYSFRLLLSTQRPSRDILDMQPAVVGLPGDRAQARELVAQQRDRPARRRVRVVEDLEHAGVGVVVAVVGRAAQSLQGRRCPGAGPVPSSVPPA